MNEFAFLAFVVTPAMAVLLGYVAMKLHFWDLDRRQAARDKLPPAER